MVLRRYSLLSALCIGGILAYLVWMATAPIGSGSILWIALIVFVLSVAMLRLGWRRPVTYWVSRTPPPQAGRVGLLIIGALTLQLLVGAALELADLMTELSSRLLGVGIWVGVPLIALGRGFVTWPVRQATPSAVTLAITSVVALPFTAGLCWVLAGSPTAISGSAWSPGLVSRIGLTLTAAAMEEVVFRVLLLTALLTATGSRLQALLLSTAAFALGHVPLALAEPLLRMDWTLLREATASYAPGWIWQLGLGCLLGGLWLRTGSLVLISVLHGLYNLGGLLIAAQ